MKRNLIASLRFSRVLKARPDDSAMIKRVWLILFLSSTFAAPPPKKPSDYSSWNDKWFATCQGESFIVSVEVGNPKRAGSHSFKAYFLPGGGVCSIGADAPVKRFEFLFGTMESGKITGTIELCTHSQELVDSNRVSAVYTREFKATYDPRSANITDANYKGEHYKREDSDTHGGSHSEPSKKGGPYQRDEAKDPDAAFEMHLYRGPAYDQVTRHEAKPGPSETPPKLGEKAHDAVNKVVGDGVHEWLNEFRKWLGAPEI
jgi:hypothetical protein